MNNIFTLHCIFWVIFIIAYCDQAFLHIIYRNCKCHFGLSVVCFVYRHASQLAIGRYHRSGTVYLAYGTAKPLFIDKLTVYPHLVYTVSTTYS